MAVKIPIVQNTGQYEQLQTTDTFSVPITQTEIDFGAATQREYNVTLTVSDANITANSLIIATIAATATTDHSIDEAMLEPIKVIAGNVVAGVSFDIMAYCDCGTWGKYKVNYSVKY